MYAFWKSGIYDVRHIRHNFAGPLRCRICRIAGYYCTTVITTCVYHSLLQDPCTKPFSLDSSSSNPVVGGDTPSFRMDNLPDPDQDLQNYFGGSGDGADQASSFTVGETPGALQRFQLLADYDASRPFSCHICYKKFSQKITLKRHLFTHSDVRPFNCTICGKVVLYVRVIRYI